ncbi:MAG: hypothetical protein Fur0041_04450 [Bacteroidia bacterium]
MMMRYSFKIICAVCLAILIISSCKKDPPVIDLAESGYPKEIGTIMLTKCAVSGCHNTQSAEAAAGLDLSSWDKLMSGDRNGAVVVPYSHEYSTLFLFVNHFTDLGAGAQPLMPYNAPPLARNEVTAIRDWIEAGAPNAAGFVKFSDNPQRKKYYVTNQGCDVVTVFDQESGLQMRYVYVGGDAAIESPHNVKISPDGQYWYVVFSAGRYIEKYRTSDDGFVGRALLGSDATSAFGSWNTFCISPDSRYAYVVDWNPNGRIARVDLENMQWLQTYQGSNLLVQPHGSFISPDGNTLYITCNLGNYIYKIDISVPQLPSFDKVVIDGTANPINIPSEDGHEILFSPDGTKYFVTSQHSNMIRVLDVATDALITSIPVGVYPQEMAISETMPYLYITCMEDTVTYPGNRGSISVINWQTNTFVGSVNSGFQPHGIAIDENKKMVVVANRNVAPGGPAPHHSTNCGGRNGYVSFIDMNTQQLIQGKRIEVSVDPYSIGIRR